MVIISKMKEFGIRLKEERIRLGLDQDGFGQLGGVKKNAQSNYEKWTAQAGQ